MKKLIFSKVANAICLIIFLACPTTSKGTSIIVYRTGQNTIVAADSRLVMGGKFVGDMACKIVSTPNGIVIGVTNTAIKGSVDFGIEAKRIASKHRFQNQSDLDAIAKQWAEFVRDIYETRIGPDHMKAKTETSTQAVFVGNDKNGNSLTSFIMIDLYWDNGDAMDIKVSPVAQSVPVPPGKYDLKPLGYAQETRSRLGDPSWSQRPEAEGVLAAFSNSHTLKDQQNAADGFTKLAGIWYPQFVGGDTDIAVLLPGKPVAWLQRKANCKD